MSTKTQQIQIRVTPAQKAALKRCASRANQDVSTYVLSRALPDNRDRLDATLSALRDASEPEGDPRFSLAELNDVLGELSPEEITDAVGDIDLTGLSPLLANYVAAMVESAAYTRGVSAPGWVRDVEPLDRPYFATPLRRLRLELLRTSPVAFKKRNLFVEFTFADKI